MKRLLRSTLSDLTYQVLRLTDGRPSGVRILTYHRVTDAHPGDRLCVPVARFVEQMRWLHEAGYQTVTFAQAVDWVLQSISRPNAVRSSEWGVRSPSSGEAEFRSPHSPFRILDSKRAVVITFDDGFEDNFLYAYPAMARYGFTGIFFVPSAFVLGGPDGYPAEDRPMTPEQLQDLLRAGHEIGAHSISHAKLTTLPADSMRQEVRGSKRALEERLRRPVDFFCYPSGDYNDAVKRTVEESGYRGACTVKPGANGPGADPFALRRTEVSACDSLRDVEKKLSGAYDWLHQAVQWRTRR